VTAVDRVSPTDLTFLVMDRGAVPQQIGAVLILGPGLDLPGASRLIAGRIAAIPRLRQRLRRVPPGCGRPIWIDDPAFDIGRHVGEVACPAPGDERALLDTAAGLVTDRLPRDRPLWRAVFVTGLAGGCVALVVVLHHVLADGIGGLAILARLVDEGTGVAGAGPRAADPAPPVGSAQPAPPVATLAFDALRERLRALTRTRRAWRQLRASLAAGGGLAPERAVPCSLVRRTGPRRRLAVVHTDLAALRAAAHANGATVNDAVLTAVGGALRRVLAGRGERVDVVAVAVPVAGRRYASADHLGNEVTPMLVAVPGTGDPERRLHDVAAAVRARRALATGPAPIAVLGPVFRVAARLGWYRWYVNHQRRLHTLVSHVRGPDRPVAFAGAEVRDVVPVAVADAGNVTVSFEVLSYAGTLTITAIVDPDHFPDLPVLTEALGAELTRLAHGATLPT
jgi:diacylglycerol O-acyltransferase